MGVEFLAPGSACVCEEDVDVRGVFAGFGDEVLDAGDFGDVCGNGDRAGVGRKVGEGVEGCAGFVAGGGFAGGYYYKGAACLEETGCCMEAEAAGAAGDDGDFAGEGEEGGEVFDLDLRFCFFSHCRGSWGTIGGYATATDRRFERSGGGSPPLVLNVEEIGMTLGGCRGRRYPSARGSYHFWVSRAVMVHRN